MADDIERILPSIKLLLNIPNDYDVFDSQLIMIINSNIKSLHQINEKLNGVFLITGNDETWTDYLGDKNVSILYDVRMYIYYKSKLAFDPPTTSFLLQSIEALVNEIEWRIYMFSEGGETDGADSSISPRGEGSEVGRS